MTDMEEQGGSPWDFSHLPTDALCVVFEHLFAPSGGDVACLPLSVWFDRWHAVSLVCGHWREVLLSHPPPVYLALSVVPEAWLHSWLLRLPVAALCIEQGLDSRWSKRQRQHGADEQQEGSVGPPAGMPAPLSALQLVAGLEGAGGPQPFWSLAALTRLEMLHLQAPVSSPEAPAVFDSGAVQGLVQLERLSLGSFADFRLDSLPASLRRLRLRYDTQARTLSVPRLPEGISLERLRVEKPGALGVCLDDLWGCVQVLELHSAELLLGVPVDDRRLIRTFERPYREGNFVPPHIWGDEEADDNSKQAADMSANHFLACLPSCPRLERLRLEGGAATSAKFMPVAPHGRDSLGWLWSVVRMQGLHHQFGLSGREMEGRQQQLLLEDLLHFSHGLLPTSGAVAALTAARRGCQVAVAGPAEPWSVIEVVRALTSEPAGPAGRPL